MSSNTIEACHFKIIIHFLIVITIHINQIKFQVKLQIPKIR